MFVKANPKRLWPGLGAYVAGNPQKLWPYLFPGQALSTPSPKASLSGIRRGMGCGACGKSMRGLRGLRRGLRRGLGQDSIDFGIPELSPLTQPGYPGPYANVPAYSGGGFDTSDVGFSPSDGAIPVLGPDLTAAGTPNPYTSISATQAVPTSALMSSAASIPLLNLSASGTYTPAGSVSVGSSSLSNYLPYILLGGGALLVIAAAGKRRR